MCANKELMQRYLRGGDGPDGYMGGDQLDGFVVSDCGAVGFMVQYQKWTSSVENASALSLQVCSSSSVSALLNSLCPQLAPCCCTFFRLAQTSTAEARTRATW